MIRAYDEIIDLIASGGGPTSIATYQASSATKQRVAELIDKEKSDQLVVDERSELDHYLQVEHIMRMARRAPKLISLMSSYISVELRKLAEERAQGSCEYCKIREADTFVGCQVDHIIAVKHGGTDEVNLAYACAPCNRAKGTDIASLLPSTRKLVRLFNPRTDRWNDHFRIDIESLHIIPQSEIGQVTVQLLGFNQMERVMERTSLVAIGHYPVSRRTPR